MIIVGVPALDQYDLTRILVRSLAESVGDPMNFRLVLIDNNSTEPYRPSDFSVPFELEVVQNEENKGYYYPLLQLQALYAEVIALMHNDLVVYEHGWDQRLLQAFRADPKLGLVGFCGSNQIDAAGGRGLGTMMNFRGDRGQKQSGRRIVGLEPAVSLDSLFMAFRPSVIPHLGIDSDIALCHFYDRIWSLRTIEAGYKVGVLGIEIDHIGGQTSCSPQYNETAKEWCEARGIPIPDGNGDLAMYKDAERRFLGEYREQKRIVPCSVDEAYRFYAN